VGGLEWKTGKLQGPSIYRLWFSPWRQYWLVHYFCGWRSGRIKNFNSIICCFTLIGFADTAFAADFQTKVIHIAYGDTIAVLNENKLTVLRFYNLTSISVSFKLATHRLTCTPKCSALSAKPIRILSDTPGESVATARR
jgi:hypothetical protein